MNFKKIIFYIVGSIKSRLPFVRIQEYPSSKINEISAFVEMPIFRTLLIIILMTNSFFAYGTEVKNSGMSKVKLQLKWKHQFQFAGYYAAIEKGFYKDAGIEVELIEANENQEPAENVISGNAEFGVGTSDIVLSRASGKDVVVLAPIFQHSPMVLLASKKSGIENVHDLISKKISIEPHAADIITYMLDEGISKDKCKIIPYTFDASNLLNGNIDAMTAYITDEPFLLKKEKFDFTIISPLSGGIDFYGDLLFTTEKMIKKDPVLVDKFLKASLKGWKYAIDNRSEIIDLIIKKYSKIHSIEHLTFEANHMQKLIMSDVISIGYSNKGRWENIIEIYKKSGLLPDKTTVNGLLYEDYLKKEYRFPWEVIGILSSIILIISIIVLTFYRLNQKLKKEILIQKATFSKLLESEEKYRFLTENMKDVVWILDPYTLKFKYVSPSVEQLRGYTVEEVMSETIDAALTPESSQLVRKLINDEIDNFGKDPSKFFIETVEQPCKDGTTIWTEVITRYFMNPKTNKIECIGVTRDISRRKDDEIKIRKLSQATEQSPASIVITNLAGEIEYTNSKFTDLTGWSKEEALGKNPRILKSENYSPEQYQNLWETITSGNVWNGEFENKKRNGEIYYESAIISPIRDEKNIITHFLAIKEDITRRKEAEFELKRLYDDLNISKQEIEANLLQKNELISELTNTKSELEILNSTKDKFFSIIAHDLKSPLGGFRDLAKMLHDQYQEFEERERIEFLEIMKISSDNIYNLLWNLLEWSKSQKGTIIFNPEYFDLHLLTSNTIRLLKPNADNKSITLVNRIKKPFLVHADPNLISTIIRNLLSNSIKFTPEGGVIEIGECKLLDDLKPSDYNANTCIFVKDRGLGMTQETINKLFRIDVSVTTLGTNDERGTGLGLILCKEFIDIHKGKIWVESELGKGSTFYFSVPRSL